MEGEKECKMMNRELKCRVFQNSKSGKKNKKKKRHRTATTAYPCSLPDLGDSAGAGRAARTQM